MGLLEQGSVGLLEQGSLLLILSQDPKSTIGQLNGIVGEGCGNKKKGLECYKFGHIVVALGQWTVSLEHSNREVNSRLSRL